MFFNRRARRTAIARSWICRISEETAVISTAAAALRIVRRLPRMFVPWVGRAEDADVKAAIDANHAG